MEERLALKAEVREGAGSAKAAQLRKNARIPAIVYGHKEEIISIALDAHDFLEGIHRGHRLFDLQVGKKKETVMIKELQYDHLGKNVIHADLIRVDITETVTVDVRLEFKGTAKGTQEGGILEVLASKIAVECRVSDIPESITVFVKNLDIGDKLFARDLQLPAGVKLASDPLTMIAACSIVAELKPAEEALLEAPTAPEVIGREKKEEEELEGEQPEAKKEKEKEKEKEK